MATNHRIKATLFKHGIGGKKLKPDTNKLYPIRLNPIDGSKLPKQANVIAGTYARSLGIEEGKEYDIEITRREDHPKYGAQYSYKVIESSPQ